LVSCPRVADARFTAVLLPLERRFAAVLRVVEPAGFFVTVFAIEVPFVEPAAAL
jgi:hypothetical protein